MASYLLGEVTRSQAEEIEEHLSYCGICKKELGNLRETVGRIGKSFEPEDRDHLPEIRRRIEAGDEAYKPSRRRWPVVAASGAVLLALATAVFFLLRPGAQDDEFQVKSDITQIMEQDRWVGIRAFSAGESGAPAALGDRLYKSDYLIFAYTNLGGEPYEYLMIFAVDEAGRVYWFHPAYSQEGEDPASIRISKGADGVELKEKIRHEFSGGRLWIYGLFTNQPLRVSAVENLVKGVSPGERIPAEGSGQQVLMTEVKP